MEKEKKSVRKQQGERAKEEGGVDEQGEKKKRGKGKEKKKEGEKKWKGDGVKFGMAFGQLEELEPPRNEQSYSSPY